MTADQALALAEVSTCSGMGTLTGTPAYNEVTRTWWIELTPSEPKAGCSPACVVNITGRTAEINWRCTGLKM